MIRRFAYTYSEGRAAHCLLLMLADRVDVIETNLGDALRGRPDDPIAEYAGAALAVAMAMRRRRAA